MPNPAWNAECESIFLPDMKANSPAKKRNSSATLSRSLTSSEIINAKKEQEENQIQKAEAAEERNANEMSPYWPGSRARLRALEALGFFITKYASSPFWGTFLYYF